MVQEMEAADLTVAAGLESAVVAAAAEAAVEGAVAEAVVDVVEMAVARADNIGCTYRWRRRLMVANGCLRERGRMCSSD